MVKKFGKYQLFILSTIIIINYAYFLKEIIDINVRNHCTDNANETDGHTHCHVIERNHVKSAIDKLKSSKIDQNGCIFSDSIIHGTELLFDYVCILFNAMICHSYAPPSFIKSSIIPIPTGTKATLTDSDKYRSIAISSILSKVLDYVIIDNQKLALQTSDYQFGFKSKSSTVLCTTMVTETIQYYTENGCKSVFLLLLDASKSFDKVVFHMLFNELIKKNVCTKIIKLLLYKYTNQDCDVQWDGAHSNMIKIFNGVKQGSVISPLLFTLYIDLSNDVAFQLHKCIVCFIHNALNHSNQVCRLLLLAKLHSISSTFATNYRHLCYKSELVQSDWHSGLAHLLGKVKMKYQNKNAQNCPANMSIIRELCDIRDGRHIACDIFPKQRCAACLI